MYNLKNARNQKGFSLVEILLVIGIIIALAIAAFVLYPRVQASQQANAESQNITAILAQTKQVFSNGVYDGLEKGVANQARIFPASMNKNNYGAGASVAITNVWNGAVTLTGGMTTATTAPAAGTGARQFSLVYNGVPTEPCVRIVSGVGSNVDQVFVADAASIAPGDQVKASNAPVSQATAAQKCAQADGDAVIVFVSN